jgi:hypothetical protein
VCSGGSQERSRKNSTQDVVPKNSPVLWIYFFLYFGLEPRPSLLLYPISREETRNEQGK